MLKPEFTGQFKRDYKLAIKRGCNPKKLEEVVTMLCKEQPLPESYRDHRLDKRPHNSQIRTCISCFEIILCKLCNKPSVLINIHR